jgi:dethiobiotin synthetase
MSAYFVTGSGTGVGKTFASCALLYAAQKSGQQARGYKPIISGWSDGEDSDTAQLIAASGAGSIDEISPWRFTAPLSPHRAAQLENRTIALDELVRWSRAQLGKPGLTLIEGVGGAMVPLNDTHTTLDWMRALQLPVVFVAGSYLGSISHTLTAFAVLRQAGLSIAALVLNETPGSRVDFAETQAGFAPFIRDIPLRIAQPFVSSWAEATAMHAALGELR